MLLVSIKEMITTANVYPKAFMSPIAIVKRAGLSNLLGKKDKNKKKQIELTWSDSASS